jgi:hypothetical protein
MPLPDPTTGLQIVAQPLRTISQDQIDTIIVPGGGRPNDNSVFDASLVTWLAENGGGVLSRCGSRQSKQGRHDCGI